MSRLRLGIVHEFLVYEPFPKANGTNTPTNAVLQNTPIPPHPNLEFGINYDRGRPVLPSIDAKLLLDTSLKLLARRGTPTAFPVKHRDRVPVASNVVAEERVTLAKNSWIALRMDKHVRGNRPKS
jgi:hypothetical protein